MPTYYVAELHEALFAGQAMVKVPSPRSGWRFFAHCLDNSIESCTLLFKDLASFSDQRSKKDFVHLWEFLLEAGKAGKPWAQIFQDGKLFHPVHHFEVQRKDAKSGKVTSRVIDVHQFKRKRTDVRVLFVYGDGRLIVFVTHTFEKDSKTTPTSEQARAAKEAQRFFDALDNRTLQIITAQGGQDETYKTFYAS